MRVQGKHYRTIWVEEADPGIVKIIDQRWLPHEFVIEDISSVAEMIEAIRDMHLRGAILIGAAAAYGVYLACYHAPPQKDLVEHLIEEGELLKEARPTAINLAWGVDLMLSKLRNIAEDREKLVSAALELAHNLAAAEIRRSQAIGQIGFDLIHAIAKEKDKNEPVQILTHCNAGWLACVDYGTATAPIYCAHDAGLAVHVWVDETRPRNQGARLTAWELLEHGVPHTVVADNAGGHLMQNQMVDLVIVGTDRTTRSGMVVNKIGTYLKALAAKDNNIPFYVALPSSSFDWSLADAASVPIETRSGDEVRYAQGLCGDKVEQVLLTPADSPASNYAFDVTPAELVTGLITERGMCEASESAIKKLFPEGACGI